MGISNRTSFAKNDARLPDYGSMLIGHMDNSCGHKVERLSSFSYQSSVITFPGRELDFGPPSVAVWESGQSRIHRVTVH
jgi:hypothetical protein